MENRNRQQHIKAMLDLFTLDKAEIISNIGSNLARPLLSCARA